MNTPNPLVPKGSLQQQAGAKANLRIVMLSIVALHVVFLGGLLMLGCKDNAKTSSNGQTNSVADTGFPPLTNAATDLGAAPVVSNNPVVPLPPTTGPAVGASNNALVGTEPVTPPVITPVAPAPSVGGREYKVVRGDSLSTIARKNHVSLKELQAANPTVVPTKLRADQKLIIPGSSTVSSAAMPAAGSVGAESTGNEVYTVKPGDTLTRIAKSHGTTAAAIRKLNNLKTDQINAGRKLKLPMGKASSIASTDPRVTPLPAPAGAVASTNNPR